jgi:hypothetical protein
MLMYVFALKGFFFYLIKPVCFANRYDSWSRKFLTCRQESIFLLSFCFNFSRPYFTWLLIFIRSKDYYKSPENITYSCTKFIIFKSHLLSEVGCWSEVDCWSDIDCCLEVDCSPDGNFWSSFESSSEEFKGGLSAFLKHF